MRENMAIIAALAAILLLSSVPAIADVAPATPSAQPTANAELDRAAQAFYDSLITGTPDRAHMSAQLNAALTDDLVKTISGQLKALGTPQWTDLKTRTTADRDVGQYKLAYKSGVNVYLTYGQTKNGTIYVAYIGNTPPQ